jgi:hypothetical protein
VIRFSAALVAVAIGVLIGGIATSELLLVYIAIAVSAVALVALVTGVLLKREELFGEGQGLVPAAAGADPVPPVHAGDSQGKVPSSGYVAPPPPATGSAAGYGVPFGGVAQATASPGAGLSATRPAAARHGRPAEPVPPWEAAATRESWAAGWMPAGKDQRAASGASVRAPSAWQDPAPVTAAPPQAWAAPPTMPTPVPSDAPAARPDAGSEASTPSWFDRLGDSAGAGTPTAPSPTAPPPTVPPASTPGSGSGWSWSSRDTGTPVGPVAHEEPVAPAASADDEDDDWPTRYSWLDDDTDESAGSGQAVEDDLGDDKGSGDEGSKASDVAEATAAVGPVANSGSPAPGGTSGRAADTATEDTATEDTAAQAITGEEPASEETLATAVGEPAGAAGETRATVIAFRSRKEPGPEEPTLASDVGQEADEGTDPAGETAEVAAQADQGAEAAAGPEDEPAAAPTTRGTALVAVVRGVPRYHEPDCVLIRFMPEGDLQKVTVAQAKEDGCTPCGACQPTG